jgi:PAS domain S-box-containing protein
MRGRVLIVEDEPIVALDLKQELEQLGCDVVGVAESAEEAMAAAELCRPDVALLDVRIIGSMDGIETAKMLRAKHQVPAVFLTSYSDESTISRAAREMPYGYLTKPFQSGELKATLRVALHKAKVDAGARAIHEEMSATVDGMREGVIMVSSGGKVQFMNASAEVLTGWPMASACGRPVLEVLNLSGTRNRPLPMSNGWDSAVPKEEFGWTVNHPDGGSLNVDLNFAPRAAADGQLAGCVVTVRDATERLRNAAIEEFMDDGRGFDRAPMAMVQLDALGNITRVNQALLHEAGVSASTLLGRSLTGLSMDPDPRIARELLNKLMHGGTFMAAAGPQKVN